MRHGSLFSGIGGFDLAAEWMGWENILQCEIDPFCQKYLRKNFPSTFLHDDIKTLKGGVWRGKIDILTGGFPCQPFSNAGRKRGKSDDRFLWPEMLRVIREIRPTWIVGENVAGLVSMAQFDGEPYMDAESSTFGDIGEVFSRTGKGILKEILESIEKEGYEVQPIIIPACAIGAWHRRDRIWIIAHANGHEHRQQERRRQEKASGVPRADRTQDIAARKPPRTDQGHDPDDRSERGQRFKYQAIPKLRGIQRSEDQRIYADIEGRSHLSTPVLCRSYDGIPEGMARVKAFGNAIVPQVAYEIFKSIQAIS